VLDITSRFPNLVRQIFDNYDVAVVLKRASGNVHFVYLDDVIIGSSHDLYEALTNAKKVLRNRKETRDAASPDGDALARLVKLK